MKWIKKNKFTCIIILVFIIVSAIGYKAVTVFFPDGKTAIYGDRLDGKINVDKSVYDAVKVKISEQEFVKEVKVEEKGRIINIIVQVIDSTSIDAAKDISKLFLDEFSESQISYYDFQIFVTKESEAENNFPIIGYKHHNNSKFSWSKDREKVVEQAETENQEEGK